MIAEAARSGTGRLFFDKISVCGHTFRHSCPHAWHPELSAVTTPLLPPITWAPARGRDPRTLALACARFTR